MGYVAIDRIKKAKQAASVLRRVSSARSSPSSAIKKTVSSSGRTDRPASQTIEEKEEEKKTIVSTPSTSKEVVETAVGERPVVVPSTVKSDVINAKSSSLKKPSVLSKQEFTQEAFETWKDIEAKKTEIQKTPYVDPSKKYIIKTDTGEEKIISGVRLFIMQKMWKKKSIQELEKAEVQSQKIWQESLEWHPETEISKSYKGEYEINFPFAGAENYRSYKRSLEKGGIGGLFATAWTPEDPLGLVSGYYMATGERQKAIDTKIKSIYRVGSLKTLPDFAVWYLESPATQIGMSVVGGYGIGKASGYAAGRLSGSILGTRLLQAGGLIAGGLLTAPALIDIKQTWESGKHGEAFGKAGMFGLVFAGGYAGYKSGVQSTSGIFGRGRGLTTYEMGAKKAYLKGLEKSFKSGDIDIIQFSRGSKSVKGYYKIKQDIRIRNLRPLQGDISLENVQTLQDAPGLRNWFKRHSIFRRSEIFGGAASDKPSTHDIDIMYRSALGAAESKKASSILGYGKVSDYADVKPWQRTGSQVGKMGTLKQSSYHHPSGLRGMKVTEQFFRLGESSLELAHPGRVKDIPESLRMLDMIYGRTGGIPTEMQATIEMYKFGMKGLEINPIIMKPETSMHIYGSGLGKKIYENRVKFYEKLLPESYFKDKAFKYSGLDDLISKPGIVGGYIPPSPSVSLMPSAFMGGLSSSALSVFKRTVLSSRSYSKSISNNVSPIGLSSFRSSVGKKYSPSSIINSISKSPSSIVPKSSSIISKSSSSFLSSITSSSISPKSSSIIAKSSIISSRSSQYYNPYSLNIPLGGLFGGGGYYGPVSIYGLRYRHREFKTPSLATIGKRTMNIMLGG